MRALRRECQPRLRSWEQFRADGVIRAADARIAADEIKRKLLEVARGQSGQMCLARADQRSWMSTGASTSEKGVAPRRDG